MDIETVWDIVGLALFAVVVWAVVVFRKRRARQKAGALETERLAAIAGILESDETVITNTSAQEPGPPGGMVGVLYLTDKRLLFYGPYGSPNAGTRAKIPLSGISRAAYGDEILAIELDIPGFETHLVHARHGRPIQTYQLYPGPISEALVTRFFNVADFRRVGTNRPNVVRVRDVNDLILDASRPRSQEPLLEAVEQFVNLTALLGESGVRTDDDPIIASLNVLVALKLDEQDHQRFGPALVAAICAAEAKHVSEVVGEDERTAVAKLWALAKVTLDGDDPMTSLAPRFPSDIASFFRALGDALIEHAQRRA